MKFDDGEQLHYYVISKGRGYWKPTRSLKSLGFRCISCGIHGEEAKAIARLWNGKLQALKRGADPRWLGIRPSSKEAVEVSRRYPESSIGGAFQQFIQTDEWTSLAESFREKVWWPCYFRILKKWGNKDPNTIRFVEVSRWRSDLERDHGLDVAHKTLKTWRRLWAIMQAMRTVNCNDPSLAVRNHAPPPRHQSWREGEVVRLVKRAWRSDHRGLACIIAIAWDTSFSPVDVRTTRRSDLKRIKGRLLIDKSTVGRAKTGRSAIGTMSRRTLALVESYMASKPDEDLNRTLFVNTKDRPFETSTLAASFRALRDRVFPGDERRLMDMRRSGAIEAIAGEALPGTLSAKLANSIERSNFLHRTYAPVQVAAVVSADAARVRGRQLIREN